MLTLLVTMAASAEEKNGITGAEAMQKLLEGNARYVSGNVSHQDQYVLERRSELISSQHPFAIVVGCSDSRVPPEAVFDQVWEISLWSGLQARFWITPLWEA
jgi:hypothetical protein